MGGRKKGVVSKLRQKVKAGKGGMETLKYLEILKKDPCPYCFEYGSNTIDHIVPTSRRDELTTGHSRDHWTNLTACHAGCNVDKGSKGLLLWILEDF